MRNMIKKISIASLVLMLVCTVSAKTQAKDSRSRFYLLSEYTEQKPAVDVKHFEKAYEKVKSHKIRVYKNGDTYQLLVPFSQIYIKDTSNYQSNGGTVVKDLADFIALYEPEMIQFSGMVLQEGVKNSDQSLESTQVKGSKVVGQVIEKVTEHPKLDPVLVSMAQTSRMVAQMREYNPSFTRIGMSLAERVYEVDAFAHILTRHINKDNAHDKGKIKQLQAVIKDALWARKNFKLYDNGGVIIEFKKF